MKVSVIIPTYNRNSALVKTISNVVSFSNQYYELIIVDQTANHDACAKSALDALIAENKITYIQESFPNLPNARNIGIKAASGNIILFLDDDVEINEKTIPGHIAGYSDPEIGCVTGKVTVKNINKTGNQVLENSGVLKKIIKIVFFFIFKKKASYSGRLGVLADFNGNKKKYADTCIGCNMSFKKDVFEKCGLFDINYAGNAVREDTDFCFRLRKKGYKILYNPDAGLIHYMENAGGTRTSNTENYWHTVFKNQCYFYLKNYKYSFYNIKFIHALDFLRCNKSGYNGNKIFKKAFKEAKLLI